MSLLMSGHQQIIRAAVRRVTELPGNHQICFQAAFARFGFERAHRDDAAEGCFGFLGGHFQVGSPFGKIQVYSHQFALADMNALPVMGGMQVL